MSDSEIGDASDGETGSKRARPMSYNGGRLDDPDDEAIGARPPPSGDQGALQEDDCDFAAVDECPEHALKDFDSVSTDLKNLGRKAYTFPFEKKLDDKNPMRPDDGRVRTMDGTSKCMRMIRSGDARFYIQPHEGTPMVFVCRCNGVGIPTHIQHVLYFFYRLKVFTELHELTEFVIPMKGTQLVYARGRKGKDVIGVRGVREREPEGGAAAAAAAEEEGGAYDLAASFRKRCRRAGAEHVTPLPPFTVTVGYTGATAKEGGVGKQDLFCVVYVRPLRNLDILKYIFESFLAQPKGNIASKFPDWNELTFYWKMILQYEANVNCRMSEDPWKFTSVPWSEAGVYTITNLLSMPLRIAGLMKERYPGCSQIQIMGCPALSFRNDDEMRDYDEYMSKYIAHQESIERDFGEHAEAYVRLIGAQRKDASYTLDNPGGWPGGEDGQRFKCFCVFRLPIMMEWALEKNLSNDVKFDTFVLNIGTLPELASKKMRDFLTSDPGVESHVIVADNRVLVGNEIATPLLISERYYGGGAQPIDDLLTAGVMLPWYNAMKTDMQSRRAADSISPSGAMDLVWRHLRSCMENHTGMMSSGRYRSDHLEQGFSMVRKLQESQLGGVMLGGYLQQLRATRVDPSIRHDPYLSMCQVFYTAVQDLNRDFVLNAANLECLMEMWMSSIHHLLGSHHHSIVAFFQGIMIMGARGHLQVSDGTMVSMDWRKPNSSGAGTIQDRANKLEELMCIKFGIMSNKNKQGLIGQQRWTAVAMEDQCCIVVVDKEVVGKPSTELNDNPQVALEVRENDMTSLIRWAVPRDSNTRNYGISTMDPKRTNERVSALKVQITRPALVGFATNCKSKNSEEPATLAAVQHVVTAGAPAYRRLESRDNKKANDVHCEANDVRARVPEEEPRLSMLVKLLGFTKLLTKVMVAVPHRSGMCPFEISAPPAAFLDWLFMMIKEHALCIFDARVTESYGRMKQGYESRHVITTVWMQVIMAFTANEGDCVKAAVDATLACRLNPLAVTEAPAVAHSLLTRGVHGGLLAICGCLLQALEVPIVPLEHLCDFFESDQAPRSGAGKHYFRALQTWVTQCASERCFAPDDPEQPYDPESNISPYLSSPGTMQGGVNEASRLKRMLRGAGDHKGKGVEVVVSELINNAFGAELRKYCHFGKELCIITLLIKELCSMTVDLRPLLGGLRVYDTAKHIRKLELRGAVPGLERSTHSAPDTFLKTVSWKGAANGPDLSAGLGVNMWALLLMGALIGNDEIHTKNSSKVATSLLTLMLNMAPASSTPGGRVPVRSFNQQSGAPETVIVSTSKQPEHFLRAINDDKFATQGEFTYCPQEDGRMPEDYLGSAHVLAMSKFIKCKYVDVPPHHLRGFYQLMQKRHYALVRKADHGHEAASGSLYIDQAGAVITWRDTQNREGRATMGMMEWDGYIQANGFLVMPMVWRRGAAVVTGKKDFPVGCLVSRGTHKSLQLSQSAALIGITSTPYVGNYDPVNYGYHALFDSEKMIELETLQTHDNLVEPGKTMWIRPDSATWTSLLSQPRGPGQGGQYIRARLNVPTEQGTPEGKLFMTVLQRRPNASQIQDCSYRHVAVDPWELVLELPEGATEIKDIMP